MTEERKAELVAEAEAALAKGDAIKSLSLYLEAAELRPTLDPRANVTHACWRCGTTERPRDLVVIGTYARPVGGGNQVGDPIRRPLCAACELETRPAVDALPGTTLNGVPLAESPFLGEPLTSHDHAWEALQGEFNRYRCTWPGCTATGYKATGVRHPQRGQIVAHKAEESRQRYTRPEVTRKGTGAPASRVQGGRRLGVGGTGRKT